ncbi:hypothetical protein HanPSC8_Chr14g0614511 [Helianthus annuus]|nr:hypothetical protein HanPSC8_Chr14g0614511 [Helianthus annuus]
MYLGIKGLSKKQRDAVRSLGFGKLLSFQVDGIPSKLGHFVVDNFDPEEMAINLGSDIIKVDDDSIHQLLGVPNSGVILETLKYKRNFTGNAKSWKAMYEGSYVTTSQVVSRMHDNGDDDGIMFKLDFLTLFITTIVEAQDHGKCKLEFLHHIDDDTDLSDINWCSYITRLIKNCKNGWKRCDKNSFFTGALTILVLLYVDRFNVPPLNVERTTTPLKFWTMERLRSRAKLEIKNGGFGKGCLRDQYLDLNGDESEDGHGNKDTPQDLTV